MKKVLFLAATLMSLNSFAFTTVTMKTDAQLERTQLMPYLYYSASDGGRLKGCAIRLKAPQSSEQSLLVRAGTVFHVTSVYRDNCGRDWGKQCKLGVSARSSNGDVSMDLTCTHEGMFANRFTPEKVNHILEDIANVQ